MRFRIDRYGQWRGYDLPVYRDRLFWLASLVGVGLTIYGFIAGHGWVSLTGLPAAAVSGGVWLGLPRNFYRGWTQPTDRGRRTRMGAGSTGAALRGHAKAGTDSEATGTV